MYTCPTRQGNSGSPVLLANGDVIAINSHGMLGDVLGSNGTSAAELTGFALGAPASAAKELLKDVL